MFDLDLHLLLNTRRISLRATHIRVPNLFVLAFHSPVLHLLLTWVSLVSLLTRLASILSTRPTNSAAAMKLVLEVYPIDIYVL